MRTFHALGHPGGSARIEDGRQALRGVVQPVRGLPWGGVLRQGQDVERRQVAELVLPARKHDHRLRVPEHVADQGVGQSVVEEHHGAPGLEDAEVRGDDLPVVLRHRHRHDLVRTGENERQSGGYGLRSRVQLRESQGLARMGDVQGGEIRKSPGGAAEHLREPLHPALVRRVHDAGVEHVRQAVGTGVRLRHRLRRPKVATPGYERQRQESRDRSSRQNRRQCLPPLLATIPTFSVTPQCCSSINLPVARASVHA